MFELHHHAGERLLSEAANNSCNDICCPGRKSLFSGGASGEAGYIMPIFGEAEQNWPNGLRAFLYLFGLVWCCIGVAVVADLFMGAIEEVTTKVYVKVDKMGTRRVVRFWNPTIANLSLLALGSSAPEIMLNVIEIMLGDFYAGDLGPSTIVGSASFNLLVIIAVCVTAITEGTKRIEGTEVYMLTATCSVLAYVWILIILVASTPDIVTLGEAIATFVFFWVLLLAAYAADKKCFRPKKAVSPSGSHKMSMANRQGTMALDVATRATEAEGAKDVNADEMNALNKMGSLLKRTAMNGLDATEKLALMIQAIPQHATGATHKRNTMFWFTGKKAKPLLGDMGKQAGRSMARMPGAAPAPAPAAPEDRLARSKKSKELGVDGLAILHFKEEAVEVMENCGTVKLIVQREGYMKGVVTVDYKSYEISAVEGRDYKGVDGSLTFEEGETELEIEIEIIDDNIHEADETFRVELSAPSEGAMFDESGAGTQAMVTILNDDVLKEEGLEGALALFTRFGNRDKCAAACELWKQQFYDAVHVPREDGESPGVTGYAMHVLSIFWKVVFATVPPTNLAGGWLAFFVSLAYIGVMTMMMADLANFFGCVVNLKPAITAITFVALGTSMPDMFASKTAAQADDSADNSVGNVTGSNCVNVFLGLGLPWTIAALYWSTAAPQSAKDEWLLKYGHLKTVQDHLAGGGSVAFVVEAKDLGLSVIVFCCCAVTAILVLYLRRQAFGGELGGPKCSRYVTAVFFVLMWFLYVLISALKTEGHIKFEM